MNLPCRYAFSLRPVWVYASVFLVLVALVVWCPSLANAATSAGGGLPWEDPLQRLVNSLRGPVAFAISMLGLIAGGAMLIFGAEINDFVRRLIMLVLVISLLVFSGNILSNLFGVGAVVY